MKGDDKVKLGCGECREEIDGSEFFVVYRLDADRLKTGEGVSSIPYTRAPLSNVCGHCMGKVPGEEFRASTDAADGFVYEVVDLSNSRHRRYLVPESMEYIPRALALINSFDVPKKA